jgi:hypothetical protein
MSEMIERVAMAIDPDVWASDGPTPTRGDTVDWHARRQKSCAVARAAIEAMQPFVDDMVHDARNEGFNDGYETASNRD